MAGEENDPAWKPRIYAFASTKAQYWISDKPLTEEEWIAEFGTGARDDAQTFPLDTVQKPEIEGRDKKIAALEQEIRKLREAALRNDLPAEEEDSAGAPQRISWPTHVAKLPQAGRFTNFPQSACTSRFPLLLTWRS